MQCSVNAMVIVDRSVMVTVMFKEKVGGKYTSLRPVWYGAPARNGVVKGREARVQAGLVQGEKRKNGLCVALKQGNVATFGGNVATLQRGYMPASRCSGQRHDVPETGTKQRRDVGYQRRDVPETSNNQRRDVEISRRDVEISRRDVLENVKFNVATLEINVATFQRHLKSTSRRCNLTPRRSREG